jgi:ribonuclease Z
LEITVLGNGAEFPRSGRPLSAAALRMDDALYLLDCGEGTQQAWAEARLSLAALRVVAISHLHPEQVLGLPGLLARRGRIQGVGPLTVLAPAGAQELLVPWLLGLGVRLSFALRFSVLDGPAPGKRQPLPVVWEDEQIRISWLPVEHSVPCVGFRLEGHPRPGRFDPGAARARGIQPGPAFGQLQAGEAVAAPDGSLVKPEEVVGPPRPGPAVAWVADSAPTKALYRLLDRADLALVGGGHLPEHEGLAEAAQQLTLRDAARIAGRARARRLLVTQLSPRLAEENLPEADALAAEHGEGFRCARAGERLTLS